MQDLSVVFQQFLVALVTGVLGVLAAFLIGLVRKGFQWINSKIENIESEKVKNDLSYATSLLENTVSTTVTAIQQSLGDDIRKSIAEGDGQFTKEDLLKLKDTAFETIKAQLTESTVQLLSTAYTDLDKYIQDLIEVYVRSLKESETQIATGCLVSSNEETTKTLME